MLKTLVTVLVFALACFLSGRYGGALVVRAWGRLAGRAGQTPGRPTKMAGTVGDLERVIYIFGAVAGHYEVVAGWLVMKAFFGWIQSGAAAPGADETAPQETAPDKTATDLARNINISVVDRYNEFVIANALSLILGVGLGLAARFVIDFLFPGG